MRTPSIATKTLRTKRKEAARWVEVFKVRSFGTKKTALVSGVEGQKPKSSGQSFRLKLVLLRIISDKEQYSEWQKEVNGRSS